jgi:hypothetical protein
MAEQFFSLSQNQANEAFLGTLWALYCDANFPNYKNWAGPLLQDGRLPSRLHSNWEAYSDFAQVLTNQMYQLSKHMVQEAKLKVK